MSLANETRRRSWFQFTKSKNEEDNNVSGASGSGANGSECQQQSNGSNSLLERVTSLRRSLGKSQQRKNKIRPTSNKGLASNESNNSSKSKNTSTKKPSTQPTNTNVTCDDEIYGFTTASLDSGNSNFRRQAKSNFQHPNDYDSEGNKLGRGKKEDDRINSCKTVTSQDSPEWMKADAEFAFYNQHHQRKNDSEQHQQSQQPQQPQQPQQQQQQQQQQQEWMYHYHQQQCYQSDSHSAKLCQTQHLSWTEPINEPDDIDRIYENMRGAATSIKTSQSQTQSHQSSSHQRSAHQSRGGNNSGFSDGNANNRKLTKDSGYESASTSASTWCAMNPNAVSSNYFHSRSDSNASSVSTGGSLSPRVASNNMSSYHYLDPWQTAKSTSNLPLQVDVSPNPNARRSSLTGNAKALITANKSVLPAKSVPGNLDKDTDENIIQKRSHNNYQGPSVYGLLQSKSGLDFAPVLKLSRKSSGSKNNEVLFENQSQLLKNREHFNIMENDNDSPPPTPPVRDSSLIASNKRSNHEYQQQQQQPQQQHDSKLPQKSIWSSESSSENLIQEKPLESIYKKNQKHFQSNSRYDKYSSVNFVGHSKSLVNLRTKYDENELSQHSQTYPLLPDTNLIQQKTCQSNKNPQSTWSSDHSVASSGTGIISLITSSDYYTASSSAMTHSPSLSSLNTSSTTNPIASFSYSRNSISSASSASSQIARSAKVQQPMRQESATILYSYEKKHNVDEQQRQQESPPPPPPPKLYGLNNEEKETRSNNCGNKIIYLDPSKKHKTSDTEIKAIQKKALLQFYLKQKQQQNQDIGQQDDGIHQSSLNCENHQNAKVFSSRKVQLIVPENNHQNAPPSPPLPPPPPSLTIPEFEVVDLPLPPPPSPSSANKSLSEQFGNISQPNSDQQSQQNHFSSHQQLLFCSENDNHLQLISNDKIAESMSSSKSEIATQTTETLRRGSGIMSKEPHSKYSFESENPMSQPNINHDNQVDGDNENVNANHFQTPCQTPSQTPWSYSRLWPKEKNVSNSNIGNGFESSTASPITAATAFISNCAFSKSKLSSSSNEELLNKKVELISRLSTKLEILRNEEEVLNHEIEANSTLGSQIISKLKSLGISDQETQKITLHCDEIEKVTRLLLSLSARLQQIEIEFKEKFKKEISLVNFKLKQQIQTKSNDQSVQMESKQNDEPQLSPEMKSLLFKQDKLLAQLEEALQLRKSIDKRSQLIADKILKKYFIEKPENVLDFNEFIKLKSKLIVEQREIKDKIHSGEKQLQALKMF